MGVKALDDKTLEVTLEKPSAYFLAVVVHASTYPVNKKVIEAAGANGVGEVGTLVSNGPFKVSEWIHGSKLTMVKNEQYWDKDKVRINRLAWQCLRLNEILLWL